MTEGAIDKPITLLIAAMGGEGGGVLSNWVQRAAESEGLIVQSTSIPGVAQRTGATTYYMEFLKPPPPGQPRPVMSLYPAVTGIDVMAATEIVEAGRAMERGFVTPERTTLVASTHRFYSMAERTAMGDERVETQRIEAAAEELAKTAVLFDMDGLAKANRSVINAVMLGAIAGAEALPVSKEAFAEAIKAEGKSVENSLAAFEAGFARTRNGADDDVVPAPVARRVTRSGSAEAATRRLRAEFPEPTHEILEEGVKRLVDFQGPKYAGRYLDRLAQILAAENNAASTGNFELTRETGRYLALWMSYEDIMRVAQLKTKPERIPGIRKEAEAAPGQPVKVYDYLKPGVYEFASSLPAPIGGLILRLADKGGWRDKLNFGMHINTTSISGFLVMRFLAKLRWLRPISYRNKEEQGRIEIWLEKIRLAVALNQELAMEICQCARLIKGYGETHQRGQRNFDAIISTLIEPTLAGQMDITAAAAAIHRGRQAALADEAGSALSDALSQSSTETEKLSAPAA